jgi:hypothetical protein
MTADQKDGADFWSRRKAAVRRSEELEQQQREAMEVAQARSELEAKSDAEILEELELPDPDTLASEDDFRPFLSAAVPERLKRRALRRLWGLNPVLSNLDGLVDYAEDYSDAATVISDMQTAYKVGRGMIERLNDVLEDTDADGDVIAGNLETGGIDSSIESDQTAGNTAMHNDYDQNEKALVQLTQADAVMQDANLREEREALVKAPVTEEVEVPPKPRRMRFEFS